MSPVRLRYLLDNLEDGEWHRSGYNVGNKTLRYALEAGMIEQFGNRRGQGLCRDSYRLIDRNPDLGDLWVE
jgi:hypothetical protein